MSYMKIKEYFLIKTGEGKYVYSRNYCVTDALLARKFSTHGNAVRYAEQYFDVSEYRIVKCIKEIIM